jgi:hypothetical protein
MKQFLLSKKGANAAITTFHVLDPADGNSIIGSISVQNEDVADFQAHWREPGSVPAVTPKRSTAFASAFKRPVAAATPDDSKPSENQNPMVAAMLRNAAKNRLTKQAILRSS